MNELLHMNHVSKTFRLYQQNHKQITSIEEVNLSLKSGEFAGITGRSGAGKSTILKCIYRTYLASSGEIRFMSDRYGSIDLRTASEMQILQIRKEEIGYVSQFLQVIPRVTALQIVQAALIGAGWQAVQAEREAKEILAFFRLPEPLWETYPNTFSGGEKLRLNLARSMVKRPKLLLLDEPTASLDEESKVLVMEMLHTLKREGVAMIGIFHDLDFMDRVVDSLYRMEAGTLQRHTAGS